MILLSRLIKGTKWNPPTETEKKVISIKVLNPFIQDDEVEEISAIETDKVVQTILSEAEIQAESIINDAKQKAELFQREIMEERQAFDLAKEKMAEQARNDGFSHGIEEGRQQGYTEYREVIQSAIEIVDSAKKDYQSHIASSERTILELGMKVAERILGKTLSEHEEEFISIVKRAMKEARDNQEVQLHVHPTHYDFLLANKEELLMLFPKEIDFYIYPNDDLAETGCFIESASGRIDASVDSQLEEIKKKLIEMLEGE